MIKEDRVYFFSVLPSGIFLGTVGGVVLDDVIILTDSPYPIGIVIKHVSQVAKDCTEPERLHDTI
jgi:hypothetical protein